ncbi:MAG TPA: hypothetical protein VM008_15310 [Phycisphaerae bacterium]|nr:hypothetical protein [Phycisphaerae bacterium]
MSAREKKALQKYRKNLQKQRRKVAKKRLFKAASRLKQDQAVLSARETELKRQIAEERRLERGKVPLARPDSVNWDTVAEEQWKARRDKTMQKESPAPGVDGKSK